MIKDTTKVLKEIAELEDTVNRLIKSGAEIKVTRADEPNSIGFIFVTATDNTLVEYVTFEV